MTSRRTRLAVALALALLCVAPGALAHGENPEGAYEPLTIDLHAFMDGIGLVEEAPSDGAISFVAASGLNEPAPPLDFDIVAPQAFFTQRGVLVKLVLQVGAPQPGRGADGASLEASLLRNGEAVEGAAGRATLDALLAPGTYVAEIPLAPPGTLYAEGDRMGIRVRALMPLAPQHQLALVVGEEGSRVDFEALRLPTAADLGLATRADQVVFHATQEKFTPAQADAQVIHVQVRHETTSISAMVADAQRPLYLVFLTDEPTDVAEAEHESYSADERRDRAHRYRVGGDVVLAHPGVGIAVRGRYEPQGLVVRCDERCPPGGFAATISFLEPPAKVPDQAGALIPPSADEVVPSPTPASPAEERPQAETPGAGAALVLAGVAAAALARRRGR